MSRFSNFAELSTVQNRRRGGGGGGGGYSQQATRRVGGLSGPGAGLSGQGSSQFNSYMGGLVGGEYENPDRVLTGQVNYFFFFGIIDLIGIR